MFRRGFKSSAEETSLKVRRALGLAATAPISPIEIAQTMSIPILEPKDLGDLDEEIKDRLHRIHSDAWSAITVSDGTNFLIVINSNHTSARSNSNLAHEIAHVILGHEPSIMFILPQNDTILRTHNKDQEEEANWLAAAILLPRDALIHVRERGMSDEEICSEYGVSRAMLRFRLNSTGVDVQLRRRNAYGR